MTLAPWDAAAPGVVLLPSGRLRRGRPLSRPLPDGPPPTFGLYLLGTAPPEVPWAARWIRWPDFRLPTDVADARAALAETWARAVTERVEVACSGGQGRTGTALACLAVLDGVPPDRAVAALPAPGGGDPGAGALRPFVHRGLSLGPRPSLGPCSAHGGDSAGS